MRSRDGWRTRGARQPPARRGVAPQSIRWMRSACFPGASHREPLVSRVSLARPVGFDPDHSDQTEVVRGGCFRPVVEARMTRTPWRARAFVVAAALAAAVAACKRERASVDELYATRMLGLSYLQRNQLPEAESTFKKLTALAPDDPLGYADLGLTYLQAGRYPDAEKQLRRARE